MCFISSDVHYNIFNFYYLSDRPLDYENLVRHTLIISAKDNGVPSLASNLTLVVDVQDVNDNPPVFEHQSYSANVLESEAVNTKVIYSDIHLLITFQSNVYYKDAE